MIRLRLNTRQLAAGSFIKLKIAVLGPLVNIAGVNRFISTYPLDYLIKLGTAIRSTLARSL
jgi:hypothetical protein